MIEKTKEAVAKTRKLKHYKEKPLNFFLQVDSFLGLTPDKSDDVMCGDNDGDCLTLLGTWELMHGPNVRVLIRPDVKPEDTARVLKKAADWILKCGALPMKDEDWEPSIDNWATVFSCRTDPHTGKSYGEE